MHEYSLDTFLACSSISSYDSIGLTFEVGGWRFGFTSDISSDIVSKSISSSSTAISVVNRSASSLALLNLSSLNQWCRLWAWPFEWSEGLGFGYPWTFSGILFW
jgi:hypothetical protein